MKWRRKVRIRKLEQLHRYTEARLEEIRVRQNRRLGFGALVAVIGMLIYGMVHRG